jgi:hypothetical protein
MVFIGKCRGQRIVENSGGLSEVHAVLLQVRRRLVRIPRERHCGSLHRQRHCAEIRLPSTAVKVAAARHGQRPQNEHAGIEQGALVSGHRLSKPFSSSSSRVKNAQPLAARPSTEAVRRPDGRLEGGTRVDEDGGRGMVPTGMDLGQILPDAGA